MIYDEGSIARFWAGIKKAENECWHWTRSHCIHVHRKGRVQNTTPQRMAYELAHGEVSKSFRIANCPKSEGCCNPTHLCKYAHAFTADEKRQSLITRFWKNIDKRLGFGPNGDCWLWTGYKIRGYGGLALSEKTKNGFPKSEYAHRISYALNVGEVPKGKFVLHKCDFKPCVRPDHLFLGTHAINMLDAALKGRMGKRKKVIVPDVRPVYFRVTLTPEQSATLRAARIRERLAQPTVAALIGLDVSHYCKIETGSSRRGIPIEKLHGLLAFLKIDQSTFNINQGQCHETFVSVNRPLAKKMGGDFKPHFTLMRGAGHNWFKQRDLLPTPDLTFYRADILRFYMARTKLNVNALAKNAHVGDASLKRLILGENVRPDVLERITKYLGLSIEQITVQKIAA